jgi:hypothetical protein
MNLRVATAVTAGVAVLALAGCGPRSAQGQTDSSSSSTSSSTPAAESPTGTTSTGQTSPAPSSSVTTGPTSTTSSPRTSGSSASTSSGSSRSAGAAAPSRCLASHLKVSLAKAEGAAGSTYDTVRFTNTGTAACSLYGYPGVSLVGHGNGTQIGSAADRDRSAAPRTVLVRPNGSTTFVVRVVQAVNYPKSTCDPTPADGLRIYPPGSTGALYLPLKAATGCARTAVHLLTVRPVGTTL